jgi:hypothetical protein
VLGYAVNSTDQPGFWRKVTAWGAGLAKIFPRAPKSSLSAVPLSPEPEPDREAPAQLVQALERLLRKQHRMLKGSEHALLLARRRLCDFIPPDLDFQSTPLGIFPRDWVFTELAAVCTPLPPEAGAEICLLERGTGLEALAGHHEAALFRLALKTEAALVPEYLIRWLNQPLFQQQLLRAGPALQGVWMLLPSPLEQQAICAVLTDLESEIRAGEDYLHKLRRVLALVETQSSAR